MLLQKFYSKAKVPFPWGSPKHYTNLLVQLSQTLCKGKLYSCYTRVTYYNLGLGKRVETFSRGV
jgi:hypothetical protein